MKHILSACLFICAVTFTACLTSCGAMAGGGGGSGAFTSGRCGTCSGSGQTMDHNRGVYETCYYCGGSGHF